MVTVIECDEDLIRPDTALGESSPKEAVERLLCSPVEACSEYAGRVVAADYHAFMAALQAAFVDHRPIVLSPDMIWLLISQGFANHVNAHAEEMRRHFVSHDGKKELNVDRDSFCKGSPENPWEDVFHELSTHIRKEIGETNHDLIVAQFSTTGAIEQAACEVVLMDSMKSYFDLAVRTACGIPEVRLEGTHDDWMRLARKTEKLGSAFELQWWTERVLPRLETMAAHVNGQGDSAFWRDIYKWNRVSGGPSISGWIVDFIPYVDWGEGFRKNWLLECTDHSSHDGIKTKIVPSSLSKVPFIWKYHGTEYEMEFVAGFTSFTQEAETFALRPKIGWAVREKPKFTESGG